MAITQMNSPGRTAEPTRPLKSRSDYGRNPDGSRSTGISAWISRLVILAVLVLFSLPLYWMIISALKGPEELAMVPPTLFPLEFYWSNFREATTVLSFWPFFRNSALITLSGVLFSVVSNFIVAYGFSCIAWPLRDTVFFVVLPTLSLPFPVTLIPMFDMWAAL